MRQFSLAWSLFLHLHFTGPANRLDSPWMLRDVHSSRARDGRHLSPPLPFRHLPSPRLLPVSEKVMRDAVGVQQSPPSKDYEMGRLAGVMPLNFFHFYFTLYVRPLRERKSCRDPFSLGVPFNPHLTGLGPSSLCPVTFPLFCP